MNKTIRVVVTIIAFIVALFFLGLLRMASSGGGIVGILGFLIIVGIPYLVWWATGRMTAKAPQDTPP